MKMKNTIYALVTVGALTFGLVGCGMYPSGHHDNDVQVHHYQGKTVSDADLKVYHRDHRHVYTYDGVRYRVKPHNNGYVYYRI